MNASDAMGTQDKTLENSILDMDDVTAISTPADIDNHSHLSYDDGTKLLDLIDKRAGNRSSGRRDTVITLDEWATDPQYGPILQHSRVMLVGKIRDYSEKAYYTEGAYEVMMDELRQNPDGYFSDLVQIIDETEDGANERGRKFVPKSVVELIGSVE